MENKYCWNLKDIYESNKELENDFIKVEELLEKLQTLKGNLGKSSNNLFECYDLLEKITMLISKIDAFATLQFHQDMAKEESVKLYKRVENLVDVYNSKTSYIEPEINDISNDTLYSFLDENENLKKYERTIKKMIKNKPHILNNDIEQVLSNYSSVLGSFNNIYTLLCDVDFKFGYITLEDGTKKDLTHGSYISFMTDKNRNIRKEAFSKLHEK